MTSRGGESTGEGRHGSREELLWAACNGKEVQTSGGGRRTGALLRWRLAPQPGKRGGGEAVAKKERSGVDG